MRKRYIYNPKTRKFVLDRGQTYHSRGGGLQVNVENVGYQSPVNGKWITSKHSHREDLKRTGCRHVDPSEKHLFAGGYQAQARAESDAKSERYISEAVDRIAAQIIR